jgi:antitoxin component HigA of HigAB toxin-antitoxin module
MRKITEIKTEDDYRDALNRFIEICKYPKTNEELYELLVLTDLMEKYERSDCRNN